MFLGEVLKVKDLEKDGKSWPYNSDYVERLYIEL